MTNHPEPDLAPCRVITAKFDPMFPATGEVLYSYSICLHVAPTRVVNDGQRREHLPVCQEHWQRLWDQNGRPEFTIDSAPPSEPVIEPVWLT